MLGADSSPSERSGDAVMAEAPVKAHHEGDESETGGVGVRPSYNSGEDRDKRAAAGKGDEGDKVNCGGNRWPRQETLDLLKIRLDMDAAFRDSSLKGPLWEEVARKLGQLGYKRSAKKCKEKFENVYKYHKRTKEGRSGKPEGKTYKFFDELQALENQFTLSHPKPQHSLFTSELIPTKNTESSKLSEVTTTNPTVISPPSVAVPTNPTVALSTAPTTTTMNSRIPPAQNSYPFTVPNMSVNLFPSASTSSSTASDEGLEERYRKKRKWKDYFRRLTRKMIVKQEEMQKIFLEAIDKRDQERMAREEAWRMQEMGRINREHEILVQERSTAAAKDAAVIAFLQKLSGQQNPILQQCSQSISVLSQQQQQQQQQAVEVPMIYQKQIQLQQPREAVVAPAAVVNVGVSKTENGDSAGPASSSSRWPKTEVHALITLRTSLDSKYQENAPKGPLWEEISKGMKRLGYNRNAKRCKEKWENINKYFKKVKESNKKRPEDSKTCPYFHQLEAIYKEKSKTSSENSFGDSFHDVTKQNSMVEPLMVQPEQQWRPPDHHEQQQKQLPPFVEGFTVENSNYQFQNKERDQDNEDENRDDDEDNDDNDDEDTVENEGLGSYEIATNKLTPFNTVE